MTKRELGIFSTELKKVFEIVRLVDVRENIQYSISDQGELTDGSYHCYAVWHKERRCENCISVKAYAKKGKLTKFEFVGHDVFFVVASYLEVEGQPYMLEMVAAITDETMFGAYGKDQFAETISNYNQKLYIDALTGAYNRRYFEEQILELGSEDGMAMLDVDHFKAVNDTYGHKVGDLVLRSIVETIQTCVRSTDAVIRYGGDEFLVCFGHLPKEVFLRRLEQIREGVNSLAFEAYPALRLSVSIGGKYGSDGTGQEGMIQEADRMLYQAKLERNCVRVE